MRILLDENLDWRLERDLPGHEVKSVPLIGWAGIENGELLQRAQTEFDVLVTMDSRMVRELNIRNLKMGVVVLKARSNTLADTRPLMPDVLVRLTTRGEHDHNSKLKNFEIRNAVGQIRRVLRRFFSARESR